MAIGGTLVDPSENQNTHTEQKTLNDQNDAEEQKATETEELSLRAFHTYRNIRPLAVGAVGIVVTSIRRKYKHKRPRIQKSVLIRYLSNTTGLETYQCSLLIRTLVDLINKAVLLGAEVKIQNLGLFGLTTLNGRQYICLTKRSEYSPTDWME